LYKRISMVLFPIMTIALIATAYWGYTQSLMRTKMMVKAENQYQRSFHNLSYHLDRLHQELGNTLAMSSTSTDTYRKGLLNIWRLSSEARGEVSQLPLMGMEFSKTDQFLANLSNFTYQAGLRDYNKKPLSEKEVQTLNSLYAHSAQITKDLRGLQSKVLANQLHWTDVELALSSDKGPHDNMIVDGFQSMEKQVSGYSDVEWDPAVTGLYKKNDGAALDGKEMTADEIRAKAAKFWGIDPGVINVTENGKNTKFRSFAATIKGANNATAELDFTSKGGYPFYYSNSRQVGTPKHDLGEAATAAQKFLEDREYKNMVPVSYDRTDNNTVDITLARKNHEVVIYPEKIVVMVALDNNEVIGMQATDFVFNHKDREPKAPEMTAAEARKHINKNMKVTKEQLALILNDVREDTLCYELTGEMNGQNYRIYINADTGTEEKVETIQPEEAHILR